MQHLERSQPEKERQDRQETKYEKKIVYDIGKLTILGSYGGDRNLFTCIRLSNRC